MYVYKYNDFVKLMRCNKRQQMKFTSEQAVYPRGGVDLMLHTLTSVLDGVGAPR